MNHIYAPWRSSYLMNGPTDEHECIFCAFAESSADRENLVLARGEKWYTIINRYPYTTGHIMVVCNRHVEGFAALDAEERAELPELISSAEMALQKAYNPHGINVGANLGRSAGAGIVGHLHVHLVPRWQGDTNFMSSIGETRVVSEDFSDTYRRVQDALKESK